MAKTKGVDVNIDDKLKWRKGVVWGRVSGSAFGLGGGE